MSRHLHFTCLIPCKWIYHYGDVIKGKMTSQITSLTIVYSTVYSGADQRKHQSSASLAFVRGIHRGPVNSSHKWPVRRKMFPFDDVIVSIITDAQSPGPCLNSHYKGKTVMRPSYFYNGNSYTGKTVSLYAFIPQAPLLSNRISVIHGSRINYETICCPQFCTYSYQILCHVGGTSPPTWHKIW